MIHVHCDVSVFISFNPVLELTLPDHEVALNRVC